MMIQEAQGMHFYLKFHYQTTIMSKDLSRILFLKDVKMITLLCGRSRTDIRWLITVGAATNFQAKFLSKNTIAMNHVRLKTQKVTYQVNGRNFLFNQKWDQNFRCEISIIKSIKRIKWYDFSEARRIFRIFDQFHCHDHYGILRTVRN